MPKEMRNDTAFMDRIHAYLPGWDVPKLDPSYFTDHFGFVSDFLAECWSQLRRPRASTSLQGRLEWGSQLSGRDRKAANNTVDGLLRAAVAEPEMDVPDEVLAWAATLALELRRRVKEQQAFIGAAEFGDIDLAISSTAAERQSCTARSRSSTGCGSRGEPEAASRARGDSEVLPEPDPRGPVVGRGQGDRLRRRRRHRRAVRGPRRPRAAAASRRSTASATRSRARSAP